MHESQPRSEPNWGINRRLLAHIRKKSTKHAHSGYQSTSIRYSKFELLDVVALARCDTLVISSRVGVGVDIGATIGDTRLLVECAVNLVTET